MASEAVKVERPDIDEIEHAIKYVDEYSDHMGYREAWDTIADLVAYIRYLESKEGTTTDG